MRELKLQTLNEWLQKIESIHLTEIELGLDRVSDVAKNLQLLSTDAKLVIVAGTNGKGSCVATLEAIAISQQKRVACYTSPHLQHFSERIRINGQDIPDAILLAAFESIESARADISLTFFEYTTLAALWAFAKNDLDLIILEVGLGGRLDAVNIMQPDVSIVTSIDHDHADWLGDDLQQIAFEKSGIFREDSINLVGDQKSYDLIMQARPELSKKIELVSKIISEDNGSNQSQYYEQFLSDYNLIEQNVGLAFRAFNQLFEIQSQPLDLQDVGQCFQLQGRFQKLCERPLTILDVAHNPQATANLALNLSRLAQNKARYAICGLMKDKAIEQILSIIEPQIDQCIFVDMDSARAASSKDLLAIWSRLSHKKASTKNSVADAYRWIIDNSDENAQIIVFGSFITVAAMLQYHHKSD